MTLPDGRYPTACPSCVTDPLDVDAGVCFGCGTHVSEDDIELDVEKTASCPQCNYRWAFTSDSVELTCLSCHKQVQS